MQVTIAIPTFNRADQLAETLRSLEALQVPESVGCQVLVVDNASTDHTATVAHNAARQAPFELRHVIEDRQGLCFGRNRALAESVTEHVVFLDDDVEVSPKWVTSYLNAVRTFDADCVVGPVEPIFPRPLPVYATRGVLSVIGSDYSRKGDRAFVLPYESAHEIPGCNFGIKRSVALELGGFNTSLDRIGLGMLAGGDFELGMRMASSGKKVVYEPGCSIRHLIPANKLDQSYLRRRVDGLGLTAAKLRGLHGPRRETREWLKDGKRTLALWMRWQKSRALGAATDAFEWELRTRLQWSYLVAADPKANRATEV